MLAGCRSGEQPVTRSASNEAPTPSQPAKEPPKTTPSAHPSEPAKKPEPSAPVQTPKGEIKLNPKAIPKPNGPAEPPKALYQPTPPGQEGWHVSKLKALDLAKKVDAKLAGLKGASWYWRVFGSMPEGVSQAFGEGMVVGPTKFRYQYPAFGTNMDEYIVRNTWIADGKQAALLSRKGLTDPKPVAKLNRAANLRLTQEFPNRLGELFFAGIGTNQRPLTAYLAEVTKPGSGYKVVTEDRSLLYEGKSVNNTRILVTRPADKKKKTSALELEVVVNANYLLPVSARVSETLPNGKKRQHTWGAQWKLDKGQKFDPKQFEIPAGPF
jgi:hypothetical protein